MKSISKKTVALIALLSTLGAVTAIASYDDDDSYKYKNKKYSDYYKNKKMCDKRGKYQNDKGRFLSMMLNKVDLSKDQEKKIEQFTKEFQDDRVKVFDAFTSDGFDKQKYLQAHENRKENMIKARANYIEKVYLVLTKSQKKEIKQHMEDFYDRSKRGMCYNRS